MNLLKVLVISAFFLSTISAQQLQAEYVLNEHDLKVITVAWSPDSSLLATGGDANICIFDQEGNLLNKFEIYQYAEDQPNHRTLCLKFSPNGAYLIAGDNVERQYVLDVANDYAQVQYLGIEEDVSLLVNYFSIDFSPGCYMVAGGEGTITTNYQTKIWDFCQGQQILTLDNGQGDIHDVLWHVPDIQGFIITASQDTRIKVYSDYDFEIMQTLTDHTDEVNQLAITQDGVKMASAANNELIIWEVGNPFTGDGWEVLTKVYYSDTFKLQTVSWSASGDFFATGASDGLIKLWSLLDIYDVDLGEVYLRQTLADHSSEVKDVNFSPQGDILASASDDKSTIIFSLCENQDCLSCLDGEFPQYPACYFCHESCETCVEPGEFNCLSCDINSYWKFFLQGMCFSDCPAGYFLKEGTSDTVESCEPCDVECATCDGEFSCLTCTEGFLWHENQCLSNCPTGWFESPGGQDGDCEWVEFSKGKEEGEVSQIISFSMLAMIILFIIIL